MLIQTEYDFTLPRGYIGPEGTICREGRMRLATALDEIEATRDPKVRNNPDYLSVALLSRVVVKIEGLAEITPQVIEGLFTADFSFLQKMYETVNGTEDPVVRVQCPHCGEVFTDTLNFTSGE